MLELELNLFPYRAGILVQTGQWLTKSSPFIFSAVSQSLFFCFFILSLACISFGLSLIFWVLLTHFHFPLFTVNCISTFVSLFIFTIFLPFSIFFCVCVWTVVSIWGKIFGMMKKYMRMDPTNTFLMLRFSYPSSLWSMQGDIFFVCLYIVWTFFHFREAALHHGKKKYYGEQHMAWIKNKTNYNIKISLQPEGINRIEAYQSKICGHFYNL